MSTPDQKTCFVVMGFGIKTDFATGRKLNLDKSYQALIKPVVESKGLICVRADDIVHAGSIELQMFQELLSADLVIADLSTANVNAFYELGVRHALKPKTTIMMSESLFTNPFDVRQFVINTYEHLGESIDYFEVMRFQKKLGEIIDTVMGDEKLIDSPVYTFLDDLIPPCLQEKIDKAIDEATPAAAAPATPSTTATTRSIMVEQAENALRNKQFETAKVLFKAVLDLSGQSMDTKQNASDPYLMQRLALCTFKSQQPDLVTSLHDALNILEKIDLDRTNDPETVSLAGSIEKRLYEEGQGDQHVNDAILYYQRGFYLLHNRYNGVNLAYLLTARATTLLYTSKDEKIADIVWANRARREVLELCARDAGRVAYMQTQADTSSEEIQKEQNKMLDEEKFWIAVNKAEAHFGLRNLEEYANALEEARNIPHDESMMDSFSSQVAKLETIIGKLMAEGLM